MPQLSWPRATTLTQIWVMSAAGECVRPTAIIIVDSASEIEYQSTPGDQDPGQYPCYVFTAAKRMVWTTTAAAAMDRAGDGNTGYMDSFEKCKQASGQRAG